MSSDVTALLLAREAGEDRAFEQLLKLLYRDLHRLARSYLRRERPGHTLQPTALINEAYLRLVDQKRTSWRSRAHFLGIAAQAMRRILVDHARRKKAAKRGGSQTAPLPEWPSEAAPWNLDLLALDDALHALAQVAPRQSRVVELRHFGGLTLDEAAVALDISPATVKLDWQMARSWLFRRLSRGEKGS